MSPEWGAGSTEIIYLADDQRLMAAPFSATQTSGAGAPRTLFRLDNLAEIDQFVFPTSNVYAAASNGERFLVAVRAPDPGAPPISIMANWRALLRR